MRLASRITALVAEADGITLGTRDTSIRHSHVILAVAPQHLHALAAQVPALEPIVHRLALLWSFAPQTAFLLILVFCVVVSGFVNDTPVVVLMIPVLVAFVGIGWTPI